MTPAGTHYDVIVLGVGGFGSAACYHLARRGVRVLGLEQFPLVHDRGSSHGETRIIRLAYFEHPDYVPLLRRAYQLWDELENSSGKTLFRKTRLLIAGPPDGEAISGALRAAREHRLDIEQLTAAEACQRYPDFRLPDNHDVVIEPDAGFLHVEECVRTHIDEARLAGAEIQSEVPVLGWGRDGANLYVDTKHGRFSATKLVITAGAWSSRILADAAMPLKVVRKFVGWYEVEPGAYHVDRGYPTFYIEQNDGAVYGFPSIDGRTMKFAEHSAGGEIVHDPAVVDRTARPEDRARLEPFRQAVLLRCRATLDRHSVCLYTLTPDHHFVIDRHPQEDGVIVAAGFSGHGFKFTSVIGEVLADLAWNGRTDAPIEFLHWNRPALQPQQAST
jgi:sarcosine oxidase